MNVPQPEKGDTDMVTAPDRGRTEVYEPELIIEDFRQKLVASLEKEKLSATMKLRPEQKIIFGQTVGFLK